MKPQLAIRFAVVASLAAFTSSALAAQAVPERSYSRSEKALSESRPNITSGGPLSAFAFDGSGAQLVAAAREGETNGPYQGGPHPR